MDKGVVIMAEVNTSSQKGCLVAEEVIEHLGVWVGEAGQVEEKSSKAAFT
jgi:hypothetical protein